MLNRISFRSRYFFTSLLDVRSFFLASCPLCLLLLFFSSCAMVARPSFSHPVPKDSETPRYFRGVSHVHSEFSGDSSASLKKIMSTAKKVDLDFVIVTDHFKGKFSRHPELAPSYGASEGSQILRPKAPQDDNLELKAVDPLLILGREINTPDGHLLAMGIPEEIDPPAPIVSQPLIDWIHRQGGYAVIAHPVGRRTPWRNEDIRDEDGVEIYNFAYAFYLQNKTALGLKALWLTPNQFMKAAASRKNLALDFWNGTLETARRDNRRRVSVFAGADAKLQMSVGGLTPENFPLFFKSFTLYAYADRLSEEAILRALFRGESFLAFEARGRADGFSFEAIESGRTIPVGQATNLQGPVLFRVRVPLEAEISLLRDGVSVASEPGTEMTFRTSEPGIYRVEVTRKGGPWILSNPITLSPQEVTNS